jgi:hypothetical protein
MKQIWAISSTIFLAVVSNAVFSVVRTVKMTNHTLCSLHQWFKGLLLKLLRLLLGCLVLYGLRRENDVHYSEVVCFGGWLLYTRGHSVSLLVMQISACQPLKVQTPGQFEFKQWMIVYDVWSRLLRVENVLVIIARISCSMTCTEQRNLVYTKSFQTGSIQLYAGYDDSRSLYPPLWTWYWWVLSFHLQHQYIV